MFELKKQEIESIVLNLISKFCKVPLAECVMKYNLIKGTYNDELSKRWYDSNCSDVSFYNTMEYLLDNLNSYFHISNRNSNIIKKINMNKNDKIIDYAGGIGLTTIYLKEKTNSKILYYIYDVNSLEYKFAKFMFHQLHIDIKFIAKLEKCDCILFSEVFEHIKNPIEVVENVINITKPTYIIHHSSFSMPAYGHYSHYIHNNIIYDNKKISQLFNKYIRINYNIMIKGWNAIPIVYIKK